MQNNIKRSSGILMPISSLPSPYGIGTLGKAAYEFVTFLAAAHQTWWQILPVGPTSYGNSPYQSLSTFAGNPYFIDLDFLKEDKLLEPEEIESVFWGDNPEKVDYGALYNGRFALLQKATERGYDRDKAEIDLFIENNNDWLPDYALFMALKRHFDMKAWLDWPTDARLRHTAALRKYRKELAEDIKLFTYIQFLFFKQWNALRDYAHKLGVGIIGDIPIYVALDSVDVWAARDKFLLDKDGTPTLVAGVPPDYFCAEGQLWGNPLYDYKKMKKDGYAWWINRIGGAAKIYDVIRIDHFRGFESYWAVPYGDKNAINGSWQKGPSMELISILKEKFPSTRFVAEDLGAPSEEVAKMLHDSGFPGMKVLEFAFDANSLSTYLPHAYNENCVCYAGTHDNDTLIGWFENINEADKKMAVDYLGLNEAEGYVFGVLRGGMSSVARLFVAQMQDYLELDNSTRINTPGKPDGNWCWRIKMDAITPEITEKIARMTYIYNRISKFE